MPKAPQYTLTWSDETQHYKLCTPGHPAQWFHPTDAPAFSHWLETYASFAFVGQAGRLSVRKETRLRGSGYWYAYRKQDRHTRKRYLGPASGVTFARLEEAVRALDHEPTPETVSDLAPLQRRNAVQATPREMSPSSSHPDEQGKTLLLTMFSHPRPPHILVTRERLLQALDIALTRPLTLLSASAGWGKQRSSAPGRAAHARLSVRLPG